MAIQPIWMAGQHARSWSNYSFWIPILLCLENRADLSLPLHSRFHGQVAKLDTQL